MRNRRDNNTVEFFRFFFSCIVFLTHFRDYGHYYNVGGHFSGGYLAVEFFFLTSGFFLMQHVEDEKGRAPTEVPTGELSAERATFRYIRWRYRRLYPMYLLSLLFLIPVRFIMEPDFSLRTALTAGLPDVLAVQIFWRPYELNLFLWYVSALIWASAPIYWLLKKNRKLFLYAVEPIVLAGFLAGTWIRFGHVDLTEPEVLWVSGVRALAEIGIGCWLYMVHAAVTERENKGGRDLPEGIYTAVEILLLGGIMVIIYATRRSAWDYLGILLLCLFTLLVFLKRGKLTKTLDNRFSGFLGSISYAIYLNQFALTELVEPLLPGLGYWTSAVWRFVLLVAVSWLEIRVLEWIKRKTAGRRRE